MKQNYVNEAVLFYQKSVQLAPYNLEFRNKYGISLFSQGNILFAKDEFEFIISEDNNFVSAYANLGYVYFLLGEHKKSSMYYNYALLLDPNHEKTLINNSLYNFFIYVYYYLNWGMTFAIPYNNNFSKNIKLRP